MKKYLFVIAWLLLSSIAIAGIPNQITVQGKLTDANDVPVASASYLFNFTVYDTYAIGTGNVIWTEQFYVYVTNGLFNTFLTPSNAAFDKPYYLEVKVGGNLLQPRVNITSSGYAFSAGRLFAIGNSNMSGYNITNVGYLCLGTDCKNVWPTAGATGWAVSGNNVYNDSANVRVGIGTPSPTHRLNVVGDVNITGSTASLRYYGSVNGTCTAEGCYLSPQTTSYLSTVNMYGNLLMNGNNIVNAKNVSASMFVDRDNTAYYCDPAGTSVFSGLSVSSFSCTGCVDINTETSGTLSLSRGGTGADLSAASNLPIKKSGTAFVAGDVTLGSETAGNYLAGLTGTSTISVGATGEGVSPTVAITNPTKTCASGAMTSFDLSNANAPTCIAVGGGGGGGWSVSGNNVYNDSANVRVGIGTPSPTHRLNVVGDVNITGSTASLRYYGSVNGTCTAEGCYLSPQTTSYLSTVNMYGNLLMNGNNIVNANNITANGYVGIGTTGPGAMLDIYASYTTEGLKISADRDDDGPLFEVFDRDNPTGGLVFTSNSNVGIGTASPDARLQVSGGDIHMSDNSAKLRLGDGANTYIADYGSGDSDKLELYGSQGVVFTGGNVGIGTDSPGYKLDVNGAMRLQLSTAPTVAKGVIYFDSATNKYKCSEDGITWTNCIGAGGGGVTQINQGTGISLSTNPITTTGTVSLDTTYTDNRYVNTAGDTMTGNLNMGGNNINNINYVNATAYYDTNDATKYIDPSMASYLSTLYVGGYLVLTSNTNFGGDAASDVSGTYNNLQLKAGTIVNADISGTAGIAWSKLSGYPSVTAGNGLTGGGSLSGSVTLDVVGITGITVAADSISLTNPTASCSSANQSLKTINLGTGAVTCEVDDVGGGGGGGGTVTSIGAGNGLTSSTTDPITTSGTLNVVGGTGISVAANAVNLANPSQSCSSGEAIQSFNLVSGTPSCVAVGGSKGSACWCDAGNISFVGTGGGGPFTLWSGSTSTSVANKNYIQGDLAEDNGWYSADTCRVCAAGQLITHAHRVSSSSIPVGNGAPSCPSGSTQVYAGYWVCTTGTYYPQIGGNECWCDAGNISFKSTGGGQAFKLWSGATGIAYAYNKYFAQGDFADINGWYSADTCRVCSIGSGELITHAHRVSSSSLVAGDGAPSCPSGTQAYAGYWVCKENMY